MDLSELRFVCKTDQLELAAKRIQELTAAIEALSAKEKSSAQVAKETAATERQKIKDAEKLEQLKRKLAEAEAKAQEAANGTAGANRTALTEGEKMANLLSRLTNLHHDMAAGSTRGESAILQMARSLHATDEQMQAVRNSLQQIAGLSASPFDNSLSAIRSVEREMQFLNDRSRLAADGIALTTKQLQEYGRIGNEIRGQMSAQNLDPTQGAGLDEFNRRLSEEQKKYRDIAQSLNTRIAEEKKLNDVLTSRQNIMAELEQKNRSIQETIDRNSGITSRMQGGMSQANAGTQYDNAKSMQGATPEQLTRIQERITLTQKLTESEKLLNAEIKTQDDLLKHIEGLVAQRKAIDDLNKGIIENIAERKKMDDLMQKYSAMGLNNTNAREASQLEMKGASQASIDSLKTYLLGIQASNKALEDQRRITEEVDRANLKMAQSAAAARYSAAGNSSAISNQAGSMEAKGVNQSVINAYIQEATAKEQAAKSTRELAAANKYITETEERLAAAVNNANQNLNRQSTDELAKYQRALGIVGTTTDETTRKMAALKAQLDLVAGKEREQQLSHLSRSISTQMGDVGISLASGMNPLTVALQQGDQIRFALQQAGAEGAELQKAMNGAATQIASSIALTFKAMSGFIGGVFTTAYKSIETAAKGLYQFGKDVKTVVGMAFDSSLSLSGMVELMKQSSELLKASFASFGRVALSAATILTGTLLIAYFQIIKQEQALSKAIVESGAAMGYSKDSAVAFAESLNGITTGTAIEALTAFAKEGVRGSESLNRMMLAAIDLEKYGGSAVEATAAAYAKLQGEPMKALQDLAEASGRVTTATLEKAKAYKEAGNNAGLLKLAEEEAARVTEEKARAMEASMSPIQKLWIDVKHAIGGAWEEIQNLVKAGPIINTLRAYFQILALMVIEIKYAFLQVGSAIGGLPALAVAAFNDIKNLDMGFTETKRMAGVVSDSIGENNQARIKAITGIMDIGKATAEVSNQTAKQLQTNTEVAKSFGIAAKAEEKYLSSINKMKRERNELELEYKKAQGQGAAGLPSVRLLESARDDLDKKIKEAEDAKAKKDKGPKPKTSSFGGVASEVSLVDNSSNIQRQYQSELSKTEKFVNDQRSILKLSYEAGLVSKGEYIAKDLGLIQDGQNKELNVIQKYAALIEAENTRMQEQVEKRRADALGATSDPASRTKINRTADDEIKKLTESLKTFKELQQDKSDVIASESTKRYYESLKEQNQVMIEAKKHLEELNKATRDAAEARRMDAEFQLQSLVTSGSELAMLKAKNDTMQGYIKIKDKLQQDLGKAEKEHSDYTSNTTFDGSNQEAIEKSFQQWQNIELLKQQITQAGIDAELASRNAAVDAFNKYYMDKAIEVRDGTANAITEGIMNGGKAGSDAIKNVLNNILKDMLNNTFKTILGNIGNEITKAIMSSQQPQQSSGGGFFQSIIGAGLSALGGGISGGFGATASAAPSQYALSSGTDMTSGFKFRATGGFVNQGSEYIVGENGPEKFTPKQAGSITPNHKLKSESSSSEPMKVTIINNTSAPIGKVTERQISPTERALVIEEAVQAVASAMHDPNHKVSKSLGQNYKMQRNR